MHNHHCQNIDSQQNFQNTGCPNKIDPQQCFIIISIISGNFDAKLFCSNTVITSTHNV